MSKVMNKVKVSVNYVSRDWRGGPDYQTLVKTIYGNLYIMSAEYLLGEQTGFYLCHVNNDLIARSKKKGDLYQQVMNHVNSNLN